MSIINGMFGAIKRMAYKSKGDTWRPISLDARTHAINTIEYEHHEIHAGAHYFVVNFLDIPGANDVLDFTFTTPNTTKWSHLTWSIETSKAGVWYIYENATITAALANPITLFNSDRNSTNTSGIVVKYEIQVDLAAANADTGVATATLLKSGKLGDNQKGGSITRGTQEIIMKQNTIYCLRFAASAAGYINFEMEWYEHTNRD